ncbi:hypothetical protein M7I_7229 [Glarea lozoyensis 74030]|uniref:Uncharacterized protein n=1 Tax=Glarea lozoyensis (strain ATCC 74030 / MF5533) TaxID=1104152 RepID=H0EWQ6_GLAL7|nr:hypothetical protein M7I_7229 [Glarea lozoyensis 74030]
MPSKKAAVDEKASTELLAKDGLEPHLNSWCSWHKMIQQNTPPVNWRVPTLRSSRLDTNTRAERVPHSWLLGNLTKTRKGEDLNGPRPRARGDLPPQAAGYVSRTPIPYCVKRQALDESLKE